MTRATSRLAALAACGAALLILPLTQPILAATDAGPSDTVRNALGKATGITAAGSSHDAELDALRGVARQLVDTRSMGRRALGAAFATATEAQQQEFLRLFDEFIVRSYLQKLLLFRNPKFRFGQEAKRGDVVIVSTEVVAGDDAYHVDYEMHRQGEQWLASDIIVEGVSMSSNYSSQFASLLRDRSFDELLDLMRRKVDTARTKDGQ